jgi:phage gp36-like protein
MRAYPFTIADPTTGKVMPGLESELSTFVIKDGAPETRTAHNPREIMPGYYSITLTDEETSYTDYLLLIVRHPELEDKVLVDTGVSDANDIAKAVLDYIGIRKTPEIGTYCTREDVELRWGKINVAMMADVDNDQNSTKIEKVINRCLNQVYIRINSDLSMSIYKIPFDVESCLIIRRYAADLAGYELYKIRNLAAQNEVELFKKAEEDYRLWLERVYNGQDIPGAEKEFTQY